MKTLLFAYLIVIATIFASNVIGFESRKEAQTYLQKYGIQHDEINDTRFLDTVKQYRDAVTYNTELFGNRVERLLEGLDLKLKEYYGLLEEQQRQQILEPIKHYLQRLELQGKLTKENVHEWFNDETNNVNTIVTEYLSLEQWKQFIHDIEETLTPPAPTPFWSSWFSSNKDNNKDSNNKKGEQEPIIKLNEKAPYHVWLEETIESVTSELTTEQRQLTQRALDEAMKLQTLGDKEWWESFAKELNQVTNDKVDSILEQLQIKIIAFKIFSHDYLGLPPVLNNANDNNPLNPISSLLSILNQKLKQLKELVFTKEEQATVKDAIKETKQTFEQFWHKFEHDTYRRIGYTEEELKSIHDYINNAVSTKVDDFDKVIKDLRQFLIQCQHQSVAQIDNQITKLERLLHAWKKSNLDHKEL
ncbi:unnamed protein product [Cunninghamella blakesleeana]